MRRLEGGAPGTRTINVRAVNPGPPAGRPRRRTGLKRMVGLGSQVLDRLRNEPRLADDAAFQEQLLGLWGDLEVAWNSTRADRRTALTRLQTALRDWTSEDAAIAEDVGVQRYRKQLHLALDH